MKQKKQSGKRDIGMRLGSLFRDLRSKNAATHYDAQRLLALMICVPLMLACAVYIGSWALEKHRVEQENASYKALYKPDEEPANFNSTPNSAAATAGSTQLPDAKSPSSAPSSSAAIQAPTKETTATPAATGQPTPTPAPTQEPTATTAPATAASTKAPASTPMPTAAAPSKTATPIPVPVEEIISATRNPEDGLPVFEIAVDTTLIPRSTPDADTLVFALETPPPVQHSFGDLLALNKETVGYLTVGEIISLPVVQRANDNSYYLDHSFSGEESLAGTLFLDGSNLLVPEDDNLIIYGHNMRNGTMFHALSQYQDLDFLKENTLVRFDTIYENRSYIPFAAFSVTMDENDARYMDVRQFVFDPGSFDTFIDEIEALSIYDSPVNAIYGDKLLMLVTCEYLHDDGRFIVVLRELRENETAEQMIEEVKNIKIK